MLKKVFLILGALLIIYGLANTAVILISENSGSEYIKGKLAGNIVVAIIGSLLLYKTVKH